MQQPSAAGLIVNLPMCSTKVQRPCITNYIYEPVFIARSYPAANAILSITSFASSDNSC
jgi:hypothetical protein